MILSFKELPCKTINRIFVDNKLVGEVKLDLWTSRWHLRPNFGIRSILQSELSKKYFSSYEAGKALFVLYKKRYAVSTDSVEEYEFNLNNISLNDILLLLKFEE